MIDQKNKFFFHRSIKLGPAIGDWTTIQFQDPSLDEISVSQIRNVNFDSLPKEEMTRLHFLHYRLAEMMCKKFSADMDIKIELHSIMASQLTYEDFLNSQNDKVVQADYIIQEFGRVNVLYDWELADMVVNRLTGGKGEESDLETFTDLEATILETQMEELVPLFSKAWKSIFKPNDVNMAFSYGPYQYDQKISLREAYVMFSFYIYFGKGELRRVMWAYPNDVLRALLRSKKRLPDPTQQRIMLKQQTLRDISVPVTATLGQAVLSMKEIKGLQPGDVITLNAEFDQPILCQVGDSAVLQTQVGVVGNKVCLQILPFSESHTYLTPSAVSYSPEEDTDADTFDETLQHPSDMDEDLGGYLPEEEASSVTPTVRQPARPQPNLQPAAQSVISQPKQTPQVEEISGPILDTSNTIEDDIFSGLDDDMEDESTSYEEEDEDDDMFDLETDSSEQHDAVYADDDEEEDSEEHGTPEGEASFDDDFSWDELDELEELE